MTEYHKINSLFKRDEKTGRFIMPEWSEPVFEYLQHNIWHFEEKVDGTNIRVYISKAGIRFGGRAEKSQVPIPLMNRLSQIFTESSCECLVSDMHENAEMILYGEGYGTGIQKGGKDYIKDGVGFILFDARVGRWWLDRDAIQKIAGKVCIPFAPFIGHGTLHDAIAMCKEGFPSKLRTTSPEGLILRPLVHLFERNGQRVITKLKLCDFRGSGATG